jgi:hypothetical protein
VSVFRTPRRKPFWRWFHAYQYWDRDYWSFGVGATQIIPPGISCYISVWRWHGRLDCVWAQWRDE